MSQLKTPAPQRTNKKILTSFTLKLVLFSLFLFGGYYVFFLAPKLALPNAYLQAQKIFAEHRTNLVQNRVALVELARLSLNSATFSNKETELLQKLRETNEKGIQFLEEDQKLPSVSGAPNEFLDFLNNDLTHAFLLLSEKEHQIFKEQQDLLDDLTNLNSVTANLLKYNATQDIGTLDLLSQKQEIVKRVKTAHTGIEKVSENLNALMKNTPEIELLKEEIQKTQENIDTFLLQLEGENVQEARNLRGDLITQFSVVKEKALFAQFATIRSNASVKLLTRQSNLILEYDFWLKQISSYQTRMGAEK